MNTKNKILNFGIIGHPLKHTHSPEIHNSAFKLIEYPGKYITLDIPKEIFAKRINDLKNEDWHGFNVTVPHKSRIIPFLDEIDEAAGIIGAVNTIQVLPNGNWKGFNTDYIGFLQPLINEKNRIKKCLIIGAGGAARAVTYAILTNFPVQSMIILNRTLNNADGLIEDLNKVKNISYSSRDFSGKIEDSFDLIVNTTSIGLSQDNGALPVSSLLKKLKESTIVYDLIYNPPQTDILKIANEAGLKTINGIPMLLCQAEEAFKIWTGKPFPNGFIHELTKSLGKPV